MPINISNGSNRAIVSLNANASLTIAGNSAASNVATASENVQSAYISQVIYGAQTGGQWIISRGSNVVGVYVNSGVINYSAQGLPLNLYPGATLVANLVGTTNGSIIIELKKQSTGV